MLLDLNSELALEKGFVLGMDDRDYRKAEGLCSSDLKILSKDPYLYFNKVRTPSTSAMNEGTLLHLLLNEPHKLDEKFFIRGESEGDVGDRIRMSYDDYANILECAEFVKESLKSTLEIDLDAMDSEVSYFGEYEGRKAKCRADKLTKDRKSCFDIKKTANASTKEFLKQACNLDYGIQSLFYRKLMGLDYFIWLAIEIKPLYHNGARIYRYNLLDTSERLDEVSQKKIDIALRALEHREEFKSPIYPCEDLRNHWELSECEGWKKNLKSLEPPLWYMV